MITTIHPDAEVELGDAAVFYARNASALIAEAFLAEFERVCELLARHPRMAARNEFGLRSMGFERFPYVVIYDATDDGLRIFAVAHQSREPGYWSGRGNG